MRVDLRRIECFVAVAEQLSFTRAADRLCIAQPWLSAEIRRFEADLGYALFDRGTRHVALTDEGRHLLPHARALLEDALRLEAAAQALSRAQAGRLRIGAPAYSAQVTERYQLIRQFMERYPHWTVVVENDWTLRLLPQLLRGELDVAFLLAPFPNDGLDSRLLRREPSRVLVPLEHPAAGGPTLDLGSLRHTRVAVWRREINPGLFDHSYGPLIAAGAELVPTPEIADPAMREFAFRHRLLLLTSAWQAPVSADAGYVELPIEGDPIVTELYVVRRAGVHSAAVDAFWQLVSLDREPTST
jgi:DNA-binding transcriptional LysR family regulator